MECPVFFAMTALWWLSPVKFEIAPLLLFIIFQTHYFQRSFIFPLLIRGNSKMPVGIMLMGMVFNTLNAVMQGGWIFYYGNYEGWMSKPYIYIGIAVWLFGFVTNLHSDYIIRHLRKAGDTKHYIPKGGMFRYVSSANYFGEFMEWVGFAIASWSWAGVVFALWTFANLGPRSASLYKRYERVWRGVHLIEAQAYYSVYLLNSKNMENEKKLAESKLFTPISSVARHSEIVLSALQHSSLWARTLPLLRHSRITMSAWLRAVSV